MKNLKVYKKQCLHCIGDHVVDIFNALDILEVDSTTLTCVMEKFEQYFIPKSNTSVELHKFNMRTQGASESFEFFLKNLRSKVSSCAFDILILIF